MRCRGGPRRAILSAVPDLPRSQVRLPNGGKLSPVWIGLATGGSLALVSIAFTQIFDWVEGTPLELRFWAEPRGWFDVVVCGLFGWTLGGGLALVRGARHDLEALRPALRVDAAPADIGALSRRSLFGAAAAGLVLGIGINFTPANWPDGFPGLRDGFFLWATLRTILITWAMCTTGLIAATIATRFSRLGPTLRIDDPLDLRPLAPLGRSALRSVAVWVGISAFLALMMIAPFGRSIFVGGLVASAVVAVLAFVGPVRGARRRLVELRDGELAAVRTALRARLDMTTAPDSRWSELSVADLLAWEHRVEGLSTWPFDTTTIVRFGIYSAIGLGSWIGAALVERALGAAFG